jgi:hypothetical protein
MGLKAGELDGNDNFLDPDCMAKYMEDAMPEPADPDDTGKGGRREFLIAISTGVINYLHAHQGDSFVIDVQTESSHDHPATFAILVD